MLLLRYLFSRVCRSSPHRRPLVVRLLGCYCWQGQHECFTRKVAAKCASPFGCAALFEVCKMRLRWVGRENLKFRRSRTHVNVECQIAIDCASVCETWRTGGLGSGNCLAYLRHILTPKRSNCIRIIIIIIVTIHLHQLSPPPVHPCPTKGQ